MKAAIFSTHGELVTHDFEKTSLQLLPDGGVEQDPDEWWRAIVNTSRRAIAKGLVPVEDIAAVGCSSTFSSTVAVGADGRPLMNSLTWMDSRGAECLQNLMRGWVNINGYSLSNILAWIPKAGGAPALSGKDDIGHLLYIKHYHPDTYEKARFFLGSKDYLNSRLSGKFAASYDSVMLFWVTDIRDINDVHYDDGLIGRLKIDRGKFPPLRSSIDILGTITPEFVRETGLKEDVKVIVGSPDLQSACIGSGAVRDYEGHVYIGTSSWILCHVPFKKTDIFHIIASLPSAIPGRYFCANEQDAAGGCLSFLVDNFIFHRSKLQDSAPPPDAYQRLDDVAGRVPAGSQGVIFTPWLNGEKTPVEDPYLRAGFHNISLTTTMDCFIRAVMEGVAFNSRWILQYVDKFVKRRLDPLNIIGGGARSQTWCQVYADILGRTIRLVKDPALANARGAAFIASVALGHISFDDIPGIIRFSKTFEPNPQNKRLYDELFKEFIQIYRKNRSIYRRLNR